jgi:hypothetical protein
MNILLQSHGLVSVYTQVRAVDLVRVRQIQDHSFQVINPFSSLLNDVYVV